MEEDPKDVIARQLKAYNARDIDAFMAEWHEDAEYYAHPDTLLGRVAVGNLVVDHEVVTRNFPEGQGSVRVLAIYELSESKIIKAWFKQSEPVYCCE
jgi:hypothetical protein